MTILSEIQKWAEKLPARQQLADAVLYERPTPASDDLEDMLALLQDSNGIPDLVGREARKPTSEQVGPPLVRLAATENFQYVNSLASGMTLPFAPTGLTDIHCDSGAGKFGRTRVLKKDWPARYQSERMRPNSCQRPPLVDAATADFDALVDGEAVAYRCTNGKTSPAHLPSIAVFDTRCVRTYADTEGGLFYALYGLYILGALPKVCALLEERIQQE